MKRSGLPILSILMLAVLYTAAFCTVYADESVTLLSDNRKWELNWNPVQGMITPAVKEDKELGLPSEYEQRKPDLTETYVSNGRFIGMYFEDLYRFATSDEAMGDMKKEYERYDNIDTGMLYSEEGRKVLFYVCEAVDSISRGSPFHIAFLFFDLNDKNSFMAICIDPTAGLDQDRVQEIASGFEFPPYVSAGTIGAIWWEEPDILYVSADMFGETFDSVCAILGLELETPEDWPHWGENLTVTYARIDDRTAALLFRNGELNCVFYDQEDTSRKEEMTAALIDLYGEDVYQNDEDRNQWIVTLEFTDGTVYRMYPELYTLDNSLHLRQIWQPVGE